MSATIRWFADAGKRSMVELLNEELASLGAQRRAAIEASPQRADPEA